MHTRFSDYIEDSATFFHLATLQANEVSQSAQLPGSSIRRGAAAGVLDFEYFLNDEVNFALTVF